MTYANRKENPPMKATSAITVKTGKNSDTFKGDVAGLNVFFRTHLSEGAKVASQPGFKPVDTAPLTHRELAVALNNAEYNRTSGKPGRSFKAS